MPLIALGAFVLGGLLSYFLFAHTAKKRADECLGDLKAAKGLLEQAQEERAQLKQRVADLDYKVKELEKDLYHAKNR